MNIKEWYYVACGFSKQLYDYRIIVFFLNVSHFIQVQSIYLSSLQLFFLSISTFF
jgi:hypothetical protein